MQTQCNLTNKQCKPREGGVPPLTKAEATDLLHQLDGWEQHGAAIDKTFEFKNYYHTMAFVNAVAWLAHREDHHPDLLVEYNKCRVQYSTHAIKGLSENDFICAAKVDALFKI